MSSLPSHESQVSVRFTSLLLSLASHYLLFEKQCMSFVLSAPTNSLFAFYLNHFWRTCTRRLLFLLFVYTSQNLEHKAATSRHVSPQVKVYSHNVPESRWMSNEVWIDIGHAFNRTHFTPPSGRLSPLLNPIAMCGETSGCNTNKAITYIDGGNRPPPCSCEKVVSMREILIQPPPRWLWSLGPNNSSLCLLLALSKWQIQF